jgi:ferredoxin-type protein NapH
VPQLPAVYPGLSHRRLAEYDPMNRIRALRSASSSLAILLVVSGTVGALSYGALCSLDLWVVSVNDPLGFLLRYVDLWRLTIATICPLGFLERSLVARELLPLWPSVVVILLSIVALGRVFCAWVCPMPLLRRVFGIKSSSPAKRVPASQGVNWKAYSSYAVLGGVLLASFWFRFPVFCFVCPVGLFFGAVYAAIRIFYGEVPGLELVLFAGILAIELWGFKSWCRSICPLGALLSIVGSLNRILLPTVDNDKCFVAKGINCQACQKACPEGIDLTRKRSLLAPNSCTKCMECSDRCPVKAIEFPLLRLRKAHPGEAILRMGSR